MTNQTDLFSKITAVIRAFLLSVAVLSSGYSTNVLAQDNEAQRLLEPKDYGPWENIGYGGSLSEDGKWLVYPIRRNNDKNELRLHNLSNDDINILENSGSQKFSENSQWLGYLISPSAEEKKKLEKSKNTIYKKFSLLELNKGDSLEIDKVARFSFSSNSQFVVLERYKAKGSKKKGFDIVVRNMESGRDFSFGNVVEYSWQDEGSLLAFLVQTEGKFGNGLQLFDGKNETTRLLDSEEAVYKGITWRKESDDLAVYRSVINEDYADSTHVVLAWKGLSTSVPTFHIFDQKTIGLSNDLRVVSNVNLKWSKDGNSLFFNTKDWEKKPATKEDSDEEKDEDDSAEEEFNPKFEEAPALQIWHSKDVRIIPEQVQRADQKRELSHLAVWHLAKNKFVQLGDDLTERTRLQHDSPVVLGFNETPYEFDGMFGRDNSDVYAINIENGTKQKFVEKVNRVYLMSPDGKSVVYLKDDHYHLFDFQTQKTTNLTGQMDVSFVRKDDDHPVTQKPPYGFVGWNQTSSSVLAHSKYDLWQIPTDGSNGTNISNGAADKIVSRFVEVDEDQEYVDLTKPIHLRRTGEWSKKAGYSKVVPGKKMVTLYWGDVRVTRLAKAKESDELVYVAESYVDSPDYFVNASGGSKSKQVSSTNPFQDEFLWGKAELIDFENLKGRKLQGSLFYPDNYVPGKKYPMVTYIYEMRSHDIHRYEVPSQRDYYSHKVFTSQGYFVLQPDIVFDEGDPGISSVSTMEIAVKTVVDMGLVDAAKVGLVGHSWGGYQSAFAVTGTDIFAAAVAGAGLTDLVSMYGMVAWAFGGTPENYHFEVSQERMVVPPWEDVEGYVRNSPVFNIDKMNTPLLFEVGDNDKNVDWRQGTEMYNAARRAGKQMVMLVYAKEGHGLRQDKNRYDYQNRILQWFGHYLKGEAAQPWITEGVPYTEQQKQLKKWSDD